MWIARNWKAFLAIVAQIAKKTARQGFFGVGQEHLVNGRRIVDGFEHRSPNAYFAKLVRGRTSLI